MKNGVTIAIAAILLAAAAAAALLLRDRGEDDIVPGQGGGQERGEDVRTPTSAGVEDQGPPAKPSGGAADSNPIPAGNRPGPADGTAGAGVPESKFVYHPHAGLLPENAPAAGGPAAPERDAKALLREIELRNERTEKTQTEADERKAKQLKIFKDVVSGLTDEQAVKVAQAFEACYAEAYREFRILAAKGDERTEKEIYAEVRARHVAKLADVLDPAQLKEFSDWWEKIEEKKASEKPGGR